MKGKMKTKVKVKVGERWVVRLVQSGGGHGAYVLERMWCKLRKLG